MSQYICICFSDPNEEPHGIAVTGQWTRLWCVPYGGQYYQKSGQCHEESQSLLWRTDRGVINTSSFHIY